MSTELSNGVIIPEEYSDDWYDEMSINLRKLNDVIGSDSEKLNADGVYFLRMSSAALTDSGTGNFSDLNSSYKIKTGDLVLDSGRKLYRIVSVDSTNEIFTVGNSLFKVTAESDLAPVAESGDYDDLTDLPTYGITRLCSSAITDNSSVAFSAISSTNKIKVGDFLLDTVGKMYQISSVDTANETVSVTTPLTQLAVDANVMHLSGNETARGEKIFSNMSSFQGSYLGSESNNNARTVQILESNRDTHGQSGLYFTKFRQNKPQGGLTSNDVVYLSLDLLENSVRTNNAVRFNFRDFVNDVPTSVAFYPTGNNNSLGGSTSAVNKWTKINGVEPGALSLPDLSNGVDISGYFTLGTSSNNYTPIADGWICIKGVASGNSGIYVESTNGFYCSANNLVDINSTNRIVLLSFPVVKNEQYTIVIKSVNTSISAKFYPCQGNI